MRRRAFLGSVGLGLLSGCSSGDGADRSTGGGPTATETPTRTATVTPGGDFEFVGVEAPETVQLNEAVDFTVAVRNVGSDRARFTSRLSLKIGDREWGAAKGEVEMALDPGEVGRWRSPEITPRYLTTLRFRLDAIGETWSTEVVPKRLSFGERYATPTAFWVAILGGSFESSVSGATPPEGSVWAVMTVEVRNRRERERPAPPASTFGLEVNGEPREAVDGVADDPYTGDGLAGKTIRRGKLVYPVPTGTTAADLTMRYERSLPRGDVRVTWSE